MKTQCECCGTCCRNGGAPLHVQDIGLVTSGVLTFDDLVTIRRGELVVPPLAREPIPARSEWIKIRGDGPSWCCVFLDVSSNTCTIYDNRPLSCKLLKCWDTAELLAIAGRDLLTRLDLIDSADPLLDIVRTHEEFCPVPDLEEVSLLAADQAGRDDLLRELARLVEVDLLIRSDVIRKFNLPVSREIFYFGRPLFQLLDPIGIAAVETPRGITLHFRQQ